MEVSAIEVTYNQRNIVCECGNDVLEELLECVDASAFRLLLTDKTTHRNIIWATNDYAYLGDGYSFHDEIVPERIMGSNNCLIQPRSAKAKEMQTIRTRDKAEVFTPSWVCNSQNNAIDEAWFGCSEVFNRETPSGWVTNKDKIVFPNPKKTWKKYVDIQRLEITCGEAPYLVSRYDTVSGEPIPIFQRIGLLDRKLRVVLENTTTAEDWFKWTVRAFQSVYGYEFQGDSLLLARENLLLTFIDYYQLRFSAFPDKKTLRQLANIISWNLWQMDGLKCVVPDSCHDTVIIDKQVNLFGISESKTVPCPGCTRGNIFQHNGIYCRVFDWTNYKKSVPFVLLLKERK